MTQFNINQKFEFLGNLATMVIKGTTPSLIIVGEGGLGKTHSVGQALERNAMEGDDYMIFKGYSTARGLYNALYDNNGKIIIFDDCDSILEDKVALNILKSALDSYDRRTISWMAKMNKSDEYPQQFDFTGGIIFISNKSKESIDGSILSRSLVVDLAMTFDEKIDRMNHILPNIMSDYTIDVKQDALNFLKTQKKADINLRTLIMISKLRVSYSDNWKDMATYMINS